jgi:hypothetical protein
MPVVGAVHRIMSGHLTMDNQPNKLKKSPSNATTRTRIAFGRQER